jgi:hypothetical protein
MKRLTVLVGCVLAVTLLFFPDDAATPMAGRAPAFDAQGTKNNRQQEVRGLADLHHINLPLSFESNVGQADPQIRYISSSPGVRVAADVQLRHFLILCARAKQCAEAGGRLAISAPAKKM